jgi:O-antigen ligase
MLVVRHGSDFRKSLVDRAQAYFLAMLLAIFLFILSLMMILLLFGGGLDRAERFFDSQLGNDLTTFMGRVQIWAVALEEWRRNPLFGYGPTLWDLNYRIGIGMLFHGYHAHNQLFNVMAMAGTIGAVGFLFYFLMLAILSFRYAWTSGGLTLAIFMLIALRCVTEVPLAILGYGPEQMIQFLLLILITASLVKSSGSVSVNHPPQTTTKSPSSFLVHR